MNKNRYISFILSLLASVNLFSQNLPTQKERAKQVNLNPITTAVPFMAIGSDSRSGAMGEIGAGLSPDANSIFWNTSKLAFSEKTAEIALSYSPWLRALVNDIHLSYLSGYKKIKDKHTVGGSIRFFSLGRVTFTDNNANVIRDFTPSEFAFTGSYAFKLSKQFSIGLNGNFVYSNLTGGVVISGADTKPAIGGSADLSFSYYNNKMKLGNKKATLGIGLVVSNIGNKMRYTSTTQEEDFQPTNLRLGFFLDTKFDDYNSFGFGLDFNKLMVPTPAEAYTNDKGKVVWAGSRDEKSAIEGMFSSFTDAPGIVITNSAGEAISNEKDIPSDVSYVKRGDVFVEKGSRFLEEMREITVSLGLEYWYKRIFAFRMGYFHEAASKGARQYMTFGAGIQYKIFGFDLSYLAAFNRVNPLANTVRFTLRFTFDNKRGSNNN